MKRSKAYKENFEKIEQQAMYSPDQAFKLVKETGYAKFDETVEVHFNLGIDPRHADQQLRGTLALPSGTGKETTIVVITQGEKEADAKEAGADFVGCDDIVEKIQGGWLDFDLVIATPDVMSKVGKLGRLLGAKGLMPNPKSGTVTTDIKSAVKEFKAGKLEYRNDKAGIIHLRMGKKSFEVDQLVDNFKEIYNTLQKVKPAKAKGSYMKTIAVCTTMGPAVYIEPSSLKWKE